MKAATSFLLISCLLAATAEGASLAPGRNEVPLRGQRITVSLDPGKGGHRPVLFFPGDGGIRGFAIDIAQKIASWGYDVYSIDTKDYLESFSGKGPLTEAEVMRDFGQFAALIPRPPGERIALVGWSEGAGLCLLGAASADNKQLFRGLITLGLPEDNILAWHWIDTLNWFTKKTPNEPLFHSAHFMSEVAPMPLWMLQSTRDEYVPLSASKALFSAAQEPKRYFAVNAGNHRFGGNEAELFRLIQEGLEWMN